MDLSYTAEVVSTVEGGKERGIRYLDNLDLVVSADLDALIGWRGARMRLQGLYNNGASISDLIGDSQGASNIETGVRAARLFEAWIEHHVSDAASLRVGLYDLNSEFDKISIAESFVGSAHGIGTDIAQTGLNGPSIFPITSLGARLDYRPAMGWVLRAALLDGVPGDPRRPSRTVVRIGVDDGILFAGEVEVPLPKGKLLIGHWRYSGRFEMIDSTRMAKGNNGTYVRMETPVWAKANMQIDFFARIGIADGRFNRFDRFASAGFVFSGLVPSRPEDRLSLGLAAASVGPQAHKVRASTNGETAFEAAYTARLNDQISLSPYLQYIDSPAAETANRDALVLGLRTKINFGTLGRS